MKSAIRKFPIPSTKCLKVKQLIEPHFDPTWHFHPEFQLACVFQGTGTRYVGDDISQFDSDDMVLTGANLPHVWRSDDKYFENKGLSTKVIVTYFSPDFMGDIFLNKDEMAKIKQLLISADRGIEIVGNTKKRIRKIVQKMYHQEGFEEVLSLLNILHILSTSNDLRMINKQGYVNRVSDSDSSRMQLVHNYILNHYKAEIRLEEVAKLANMAPNSFSRYFKSRTNKSFTDFIAELRISMACKLLKTNNQSVIQIAYECGYKTLSNFNKKFKEITGTTPKMYRKNYLQIL